MSRYALPLAVIGAAGFIALAYLAANHWQAVHAEQGYVYRLNRWTGAMDVCAIDPSTVKARSSFVGAKFICQAKQLPTADELFGKPNTQPPK